MRLPILVCSVALMLFVACATSEMVDCSFNAPFTRFLSPTNIICPPAYVNVACQSNENCTSIPDACAYGGTAALQCLPSYQDGSKVCGFVTGPLPTMSNGGAGMKCNSSYQYCAICRAAPCRDVAMCVYPSDCKSGGSRHLSLTCYPNGTNSGA